MPWEDPDDQKPGEPEKPIAVPELWSHVPNLESFLQELYTRSTGLSTEPTSAQFSALSARVQANSAAGASVDLTSVYNAISIVSQAVSIVSNAASDALSVARAASAAAAAVSADLTSTRNDLSTRISVVSQAVSVISQQVSALSQSLSSQAAALSVRIDTQSQGISVLSNQLSALSQAVSILSVQVVSALSIANAASAAAAAVSADLTSTRNDLSTRISVVSQAISVISQQVSALSQSLSSQAAALSVRIDTQSQSVSVLSNQLSALSNAVSALSNALSGLSQAHSTLSASHVSLVDRVSANSATGGGGISIVPTPGGRLTLTSATPVMTAAVLAAVKVFYTPYSGNALPIYNGTTWALSSLTELEMSLDSSVHVSSTNYDVFAVNDGGTRRIGTGPAWASNTARTISIQRLNGIWTNMSTISAVRYGSLAVSAVSANMATYLGTFRTTGTPGQTEYSYGSIALSAVEAKLYLWNAYNRVTSYAYVRDATDSWTYQNTAWRAANNSANFRVSFVRGLDEDAYTIIYPANAAGITSNADGFVGIGLDSTTAYQGLTGYMSPITDKALAALGSYMGLPGLGYHFLAGIEACNVVTSAMTFYGDGNLVQFQTGLLFTGAM